MMKYDMRAADKCPHSFCLQETDDLQETDGPQETDDLQETDGPQETDDLQETDGPQEIDGLQEMDDKNGGFVYNKKRKSKI